MAGMAGDAVGREPQIAYQLNLLEKQRDALAGVISSLEERLTPILSPVSPEPTMKGIGDIKSASAPIAERISTSADAFKISVIRIEKLIQRCEC